MRFLVKGPPPDGLRAYRADGDNRTLRAALLDAQRGYCAYTEKRVDALDTCAVEHFDPRKKGDDDWFNWYATLQSANQRKRRHDRALANAPFFESRFFQKVEGAARIRYVRGRGLYKAVDPADVEARELIEYLGLNDPTLHDVRRRHVKRVRDTLARIAQSEWIEWFREHPEDLSFITAIEVELELPGLLAKAAA